MMRPKPGDTIAVWFSCGAASAVAAKRTIEKYSECNIRVLNNPVREEHPDNQRFLKDVQQWLGVEIEPVINPKYPNASAVEVWDKKRYMSGNHGAPCTVELKKKARQHWESNNLFDWLVLGFTAEEQGRHDNFVLTERDNLLPVLIDAGLTKRDCFGIIQNAGLRLPEMYGLGYPNANCIGCVKATSPTYWNLVRKTHPKVFDARAEQSREIGAKLVRHKGERVFLDELPVDAVGAPLKSMKTECGLFCVEQMPLFYGNGADSDAYKPENSMLLAGR